VGACFTDTGGCSRDDRNLPLEVILAQYGSFR
jgi:hypothetical protein